MNEALSSGKVENEGLMVKQNRTNVQECYGDHGYDNMFFSMRSIFIGHGPRFRRGKKVPSFENVQIYNVVAEILGLRPAPNNGSSLFTRSLLMPTGETMQLK
ncbi:BnaA01g07260D [Brassica napus]|uniref:BnaA01g07260D protein n=1 Tax=Brassica napus TaxID=3708 RepID=A0A078I370_BRANA|nr:BnaA01g07260D [Brassica napus]